MTSLAKLARLALLDQLDTDQFAFASQVHEAVRDDGGGPAGPSEQSRLAEVPARDLLILLWVDLHQHQQAVFAQVEEVAVDLREVRRSLESGVSTAPRRSRRVMWATIAAVVIAAAIAITRLPKRQLPVPPSAPQPFSSIDIERVTFTGDVATSAISRSGRFLAYTRASGDQRSLWLKQFKTGADVQLIPPGQLKVRRKVRVHFMNMDVGVEYGRRD